MTTGRSRRAAGNDESGRPAAPEVHSITGAIQPHSDDMDMRIRRYLISMGIRTLCVILVLVVHNPVRWVFAVLAVILPYIAVVMANAAGNRRGSAPRPVPVTRITLPPDVSDERPARGQNSGPAEPSAGSGAPAEQTPPSSHEHTA